MSTYTRLRALVPLLALLTSSLAFAAPDELEATIEALPALRERLGADSEKKAERGDTMSLVGASELVTKGLLPSLVKIEAHLRKKSEDEVSELITRDLQAVGRDVEIRYPDGGTMEFSDRASSVARHVTRRVYWCVSQLMVENEDFDLRGWRKRWKATGEQDAGGKRD